MLKKEFGKRLKFLRHIKNLTQALLAEKIDVSVTYLSNIERGLASPSFDVIQRLCTALETTPANLFLFPDPKNSVVKAEPVSLDLEQFYYMAPHTSWMGSWTMNWLTGDLIVSDALYRILGLKSKKEPKTLQVFLDRVHDEDRDRISKTFESLLNGDGAQGQRFRFKGSDSTWRHGLIHMDVDSEGQDKWGKTHGIILDISDWVLLEDSLLITRRQLERYVRERTREISETLRNLRMDAKNRTGGGVSAKSGDGRFRRFADNLPAMVYHLRLYPDIRYEYVNPYMAAIVGYTPQDFYENPNLGVELIHPEDRDRLLKLAGAAAVPDEPIEIRWILPDGRTIFTEHFCLLHLDTKNQEMVLEGIGYEISERKAAFSGDSEPKSGTGEKQGVPDGPETVAHALEHHRGDLMGGYYFEYPGGAIDWSDQTLRIIEFDRSLAPVSTGDYYRLIHPDDRSPVMEAVEESVREGRPFDLEYRIITNRGNIKRLRDIGRPVAGRNGSTGAIAGTLLDVSTTGKRERTLVEANRMLRVQLREINHRIKNNMQVLSSLLNLQADNGCNSDSEELLRDIQAKVSAMSMIHEILYRSDNMKVVGLKEYVEALSERAGRIFSKDAPSIRMECNVDSKVVLAPEQALSCGLVLCELITNAFKHAFVDKKNGVITVSCFRKDDERLSILVKDDGCGLPENFMTKDSKPFGLSLVQNLVENQLNGTIDMTSENGTSIEFTFPVKSAE